MATNSYLVITDGTTTATFADGSGGSTNYEIQRGGWAPAVAGLRRSPLGGAGPYEDVTEEMRINITGSSVDAALANLSVLNSLLDQADRWYNGENTCAVLIKYSPRGSTVSNSASPLQAVILGRPDGDSGALTLPSIFEDVGRNRWVIDSQLRFKRRGLWLHTTSSGVSSNTTTGDEATVVVASTLYNSPTQLSIAGLTTACNTPYIIVTGHASAINIINAESCGGAPTDTWAPCAAAPIYIARSGSILRFTPIATTADQSPNQPAISMLGESRRFATFANIRNAASNVTYDVKASLGDGIYYTSTPATTISASTGPKWYMLGIISTPMSPTRFKFSATPTAACGSLDIDTFVVVDLSDSQNFIFVPQMSDIALGSCTLSASHGALNALAPTLIYSTQYLGYHGDVYLSTRSGSLYILDLSTDDNNYYYRSASGTGAASAIFSACRITGYPVPI